MDAASTAHASSTATRDVDLPPFAMPAGNEMVVLPQPKNLTLWDIERGVEALTSVESRVSKVIDNATRPFGTDANNLFTRFADRKKWLVASAVGAGVIATGLYWAGVFPTSSEYNRWSEHVVTHTGYAWDVTKAIAGMVVAGAAAGFGSYFGARAVNKEWKAWMARDTLRATRLAELTAIRRAAEHRPLERAAIARIADKALKSLEPRKIYAEPQVEEMLKGLAADVNLGDDVAKAEAQRHTALIKAVQLVEKEKALNGPIAQLVSAFNALTPEERDSVRPGLKQRLFDGVVGRNRNMKYEQATPLRAQLDV